MPECGQTCTPADTASGTTSGCRTCGPTRSTGSWQIFLDKLTHFALQVLAGEPEQARLAVLGGDEACALLGDGGPAVGHGLDPGRLRDGLLQGHQERGGRRQASAGDH